MELRYTATQEKPLPLRRGAENSVHPARYEVVGRPTLDLGYMLKRTSFMPVTWHLTSFSTSVSKEE